MKYLKFSCNQIKKFLIAYRGRFFGLLIFLFFAAMMILPYLEDYGISLDPNDYCNITDVEYTAVLHDDINGKANVEITEYLTYDIHAASESNTFKEIWRELPEEEVDGVIVTYDVKSVSQILPDGTEIPYNETSKMYWEDEDYTEESTLYWHHSNGSGVYPDNDESLLIYIPWTYRDKLKFKIVYSLNNAALKYNDCSELYLSMFSGRSVKKLNSYKADILVPNKLMPSTYYAYTFGTSFDRIPFNESDSINPGYHTFSVNLDKDDLKFDFNNQYIEFCLVAYGEDRNIFTKYAPDNLYSNDNVLDEIIEENEYYTNKNGKYKTYKSYLLLISIILSIYIIYDTKRKYNKLKEKYPSYKSEYTYDTYKYIPSDLDPMFASELVFANDPFNENAESQEEYSAILLSLVRKKYVTVTKINENVDWLDSNTMITVCPTQTKYVQPEDESYEPDCIITNQETGERLESLSTSERLYLELLERYSRISNNKISVSQLQMHIDSDYEYINNFIKDMEKKPILENGAIQGYFQNANYDSEKKAMNKSAHTSIVFAILLLIVVNGVSIFTPMKLAFGAYTLLAITLIWKYFYQKSKAGEFILLTQFGANEQAKWRGLYNYLKSDEFKNEKNLLDPNMLEKYLIYATAFGISDNVISSIKIRGKDEDYDNSSILNRNSYIRSHRYHRMSRSFGHSIHTSSRGGFGGHGYGGGGRGGGGGGGGH